MAQIHVAHLWIGGGHDSQQVQGCEPHDPAKHNHSQIERVGESAGQQRRKKHQFAITTEKEVVACARTPNGMRLQHSYTRRTTWKFARGSGPQLALGPDLPTVGARAISAPLPKNPDIMFCTPTSSAMTSAM
jgi:hypothetical protein